MNILAPSILSADFKNLGRDIKEIERGGAEYVHIDVMDGMFVPSISFGMPVISSIRNTTDLVFDVHLMIQEPIRYIKEFKACGADIITVHLEACSDPVKTLEEIKNAGLKAGLSIKPATDVLDVKPYLQLCDMILLMSVEPGFGGQKFMEVSIERAKELRAIIDEFESSVPEDTDGRAHHIDLEIDGGIKLDNVERVLECGVNVIVAGSAVFSSPYENTVKFMEILKG